MWLRPLLFSPTLPNPPVASELFLEDQTENTSYLVITSTWLIPLSWAYSLGHIYLLNLTWLTLITAQVAWWPLSTTAALIPTAEVPSSFAVLAIHHSDTN